MHWLRNEKKNTRFFDFAGNCNAEFSYTFFIRTIQLNDRIVYS